jgi:hypothetical protein
MSVNIRALDLLLSQLGPEDLTWPAASHALRQAMTKAPVLPRFSRRPLTDDDVRLFIKRRLTEDRRLTCTRLHRALRDSGSACEQKRFRRLFDELKESDV